MRRGREVYDGSMVFAPHVSTFGHSEIDEGNREGVVFGVVLPPPYEHPFVVLVAAGDDTVAANVGGGVPVCFH